MPITIITIIENGVEDNILIKLDLKRNQIFRGKISKNVNIRG